MAPVSMRKEIGLPATVRVTLGSVEVMRVGAWGPGHRQSSAVSLRRLGRAESEDSCSGAGGDVWIPGRRFGSGPSNVPLYHRWDMDLKQALALGMSGLNGLLYHI